MTITPEDIATLRAPFTPLAVKFRIDVKEASRGKVRCVVYIDSPLAADRLTAIDPDWSTTYATLGTPSEHTPVACRLTLKGVTREGVGQYAKAGADDKHMKSAYSDAMKRAAVEFHVGAYLRGMPMFACTEAGVWKMGNGKLGGINDLGLKQLREQYAAAINRPEMVARWGTPIDHGDLDIQTGDVIPTEGVIEAADVPLLDERQAGILFALARLRRPNGNEDTQRAYFAQMPSDEFGATMVAALDGAVKERLVSQEDREKLEELVTSGGDLEAVCDAITDSTAPVAA